MTKPADITALFNKFAGREVPMKQWSVTVEGKHYEGLRPVDNHDPVIAEMNNLAGQHGLELMIWNPSMKEADFAAFRKPSNVNVYIEKQADGKYRIGDKVTLG